jgi:hypothetical protein
MTGLWFSPVSSTNKTYRHDIAENVLFVNDDILLPFKNLKGHYVLLFNNNKEKQTNTNNNKQTNQKIDNKKIK